MEIKDIITRLEGILFMHKFGKKEISLDVKNLIEDLREAENV